MPRLKVNDLIRISWHDTVADSGWHDSVDAPANTDGSDMMHHSVGYIVTADDDKVVIAMTVGDGLDHYGELLNIPQGCVKGITKLKEEVSIRVYGIPQSHRISVG